MKTSIRQCISCFSLMVALIASLFCATGCAWLMTAGTTSRQSPDPLVGWKIDFNHQPDQAIVKDYQDYIQKLPPDERNYVGPVFYLKDGMGQHAIRVEIFVKRENASWHYAFIYNKDNRRIKVIKYWYTRYQS